MRECDAHIQADGEPQEPEQGCAAHHARTGLEVRQVPEHSAKAMQAQFPVHQQPQRAVQAGHGQARGRDHAGEHMDQRQRALRRACVGLDRSKAGGQQLEYSRHAEHDASGPHMPLFARHEDPEPHC